MNKREQLQHYKDTRGTPINQEDYTYVDSKQIQIRSVIEVMDRLGYEFNIWDEVFCAKVPTHPTFKGCETISFPTAVLIHNSLWLPVPKYSHYAPSFKWTRKMDGGYFDKAFWIDADKVYYALSGKIVEAVYLTNKNKVLKAYKQQLKFVRKEYEQLFLNPLLKGALQ